MLDKILERFDYIVENRPLFIAIPLILFFSAFIPKGIDTYFYQQAHEYEFIRKHNEEIKIRMDRINAAHASH